MFLGLLCKSATLTLAMVQNNPNFMLLKCNFQHNIIHLETRALKYPLQAKKLILDKCRSDFYLGMITANGKKVVATDVMADNGIIHIIEDVLYPLPQPSFIEMLSNNPMSVKIKIIIFPFTLGIIYRTAICPKSTIPFTAVL